MISSTRVNARSPDRSPNLSLGETHILQILAIVIKGQGMIDDLPGSPNRTLCLQHMLTSHRGYCLYAVPPRPSALLETAFNSQEPREVRISYANALTNSQLTVIYGRTWQRE